jgi:hypothetical protein
MEYTRWSALNQSEYYSFPEDTGGLPPVGFSGIQQVHNAVKDTSEFTEADLCIQQWIDTQREEDRKNNIEEEINLTELLPWRFSEDSQKENNIKQAVGVQTEAEDIKPAVGIQTETEARTPTKYKFTQTPAGWGMMVKTVYRKHHDCLTCGQIFASQGVLQEHIKEDHAPKPVVCLFCGERQMSRKRLFLHIETYHKSQNKV